MAKQSKKIIRRMCLSNWGGISHEMLTFHEYINLFSGKSGSGKSTVMDAIQVVLYGSFHQSFLNKAADDSKNRRSVLSYLRGAQKDGTSNREGEDFCAILSLEIEDTLKESYACVGVVFEVGKNDTEIKKYNYFSHGGKMPESEYLTKEGYPYSVKEIRQLVEQRKREGIQFDRGDINRVYGSAEAYRRTLYDGIFGYIDGNRFVTMEKSAIALQMSNGTGQFIRDYMFPKSEAGAIEDLSDQLGVYRDIKERIDDMKDRMDLLEKVNENWVKKLSIETKIFHKKHLKKGLEIRDIQDHLDGNAHRLEQNRQEQEKIQAEKEQLEQEKSKLEQKIIQKKADLKASNLGGKREQLEKLDQLGETLAFQSHGWRDIIEGLQQWNRNQVVADYISSDVAILVEKLAAGQVTKENIDTLRETLEKEKGYLEEQIEDSTQELRKLSKQQEEKRNLIEDIKNNRKTYPEELRKAKSILTSRLKDRYRQTEKITVYVLADLFEVTQKEWKDAIEGRLGRLKYALITEPEYAHEAAKAFRTMKNYENVDLINSKELLKRGQEPQENSLYEAVTTQYDFVDVCLKRYLGHISKCDSLEELEQVRDGVTKDCYSYSNFMFRHLKKKDYTTRACIGGVVSREKLADYQQELIILNEKADDLAKELNGLKQYREYESLKRDTGDLMKLSTAGKELEKINGQKITLEREIEQLSSGAFAQMEKELKEEETVLAQVQKKYSQTESRLIRLSQEEGAIHADQRILQESLEENGKSVTMSEELEEEIEELLAHYSSGTLRRNLAIEISDCEENLEKQMEQIQLARNEFNRRYPACGLSGAERTNDAYDKLLKEYRENYKPQYEKEFQKQCDTVYRGLRENVIATIHSEMKEAKRHQYEINRLLKQTHFSDSIYQIDIQPAEGEYRQFYEMLMAEELDSKNVDNAIEGQISFGDDAFYEKYQVAIERLTDKFMPIRGNEEESVILRRRREMEEYADYRNYLSFRMYELIEEPDGKVRKSYVDDMAGRDSGGEGQNPKYVTLLAGFAMLYMPQTNRDSKIRLVLLDEAFSKMDQERSGVCLQYSRMMDLQLIVCVPDERLQSLIRNVDCVYGFRRHKNNISMMHIDKGNYLSLLNG